MTAERADCRSDGLSDPRNVQTQILPVCRWEE